MAKAVVKYIPEACEAENPMLSGHVEIIKPSYETFLNNQEILKEKEGESELDYQKRILGFAKPLVKKVSLKHIDGSTYTSLDDLLDDVEVVHVLSDIALACYFGPTKKKRLTEVKRALESSALTSEPKSESSDNSQKQVPVESPTSVEPVT